MSLSSDQPLTVQALIDSFDPNVVGVAGSRGFSRPIEGVSVGEEDDPLRWMAPHSLLLTSGMMLKAEPGSGGALVERLSSGGMTALGLGMAPYWTEVPESLVAAGNRLAFPVLQISGVRFHQIMSHIFSALSSSRIYMLQRTVTMQHSLADILSKNGGVEEIVPSLAEFLDADVFLFDWAGHILIRSSHTPPSPDLLARVWSLYLSEHHDPHASDEPRLEGSEVHFREVRPQGALENVLAAVLPLGQHLDLLVERTLSFGRILLELAVLANRDRLGHLRRSREALLLELLQGDAETGMLSERLAHYDIVSSDCWRLIVLAPQPTTSGIRRSSNPSGLLASQGALLVNDYLESLGARFLTAPKADVLVVLLALALGEHTLDARQFTQGLIEHVREALGLGPVSAGLSEPFCGAGSAADALTHARQALFSVRNVRGAASVVLYEDLGLHFAALNALDDDALRRFEARVVEPLQAIDQTEGRHLQDTLATYFAHKRSLSDTADALFVHRNTLSRRLEVIEQVLGIDLRETDDLVETYLAFVAAGMLGPNSSRRTS